MARMRHVRRGRLLLHISNEHMANPNQEGELASLPLELVAPFSIAFRAERSFSLLT